MSQSAVVHPAMVFDPSGMVRVLVKVLRRNVVMLATDHAAKAAEVGLDLIGRDVSVCIGAAVVYAERPEGHMQRIPVSGLIGIKGRGLGGDASGDLEAFGFCFDDKGKRPAAALAKGDYNPAPAALIDG